MAEECGTEKNLTDTEKKIIKQVEYYFGDINLPKDRLLNEEAAKDDGWVSLETLLKFNRLKVLSTDAAFIADTLQKSGNGLVEVDAAKAKLRRCKDKPLPENRLEFWKQLKTRTVYVKGFPADSTMDRLMEFFGQHGKVETLLMRRTKDTQHLFKGSVFVTFESRDLCQRFLSQESTKFDDVELVKMFESDYYAKKNEERKQTKMQKQKGNAAATAMHEKSATNGEKGGDHAVKYTRGLVVHLTDFPEKNQIDRDAIKVAFLKFGGEVDWIDFNRGEAEAFVRVKGAESAAVKVLEEAKAANGGKMILGENVECQATVLAGDEESAYWRKTVEARKQALERKGKGKKNKARNKGDFKRGGDKRRGGRAQAENGANAEVARSGVKRAHDGTEGAEQSASKAAKAE